MANTCKICKHPNSKEIEARIALGQKLCDIAKDCAISSASVLRHRDNCMREALEIAKSNGKVKIALTTRDHLQELFEFATKMRDACHRWLQDPANDQQYTLDSRSDEGSIIYNEIIGYTDKGKPIYEKRRESLQVLLDRVRSGLGYEIKAVEFRKSDPRKLIIEVLDQLHRDCDMLAKLSGDYQQERVNEHDQALLRETTIQAVKLLYSKSRAEAQAQIEAEEQAIAEVWPEAERLAKQALATEVLQ